MDRCINDEIDLNLGTYMLVVPPHLRRMSEVEESGIEDIQVFLYFSMKIKAEY